ncbi:hypothetical protein C2E23DRAFT_456248 [Lenzites betulinus]|nr:hypothetical protein C2E23DRAFT_456248 [Lenzites betulinus]
MHLSPFITRRRIIQHGRVIRISRRPRKHARLVALRNLNLTSRSVPCVLWAEDTLCYVHRFATLPEEQKIVNELETEEARWYRKHIFFERRAVSFKDIQDQRLLQLNRRRSTWHHSGYENGHGVVAVPSASAVVRSYIEFLCGSYRMLVILILLSLGILSS